MIGDAAEHLIAARVAVAVVDSFEMIDVQHDQRDPAAAVQQPAFAVKKPVDAPPVGETGQRILLCEAGQLPHTPDHLAPGLLSLTSILEGQINVAPKFIVIDGVSPRQEPATTYAEVRDDGVPTVAADEQYGKVLIAF